MDPDLINGRNKQVSADQKQNTMLSYAEIVMSPWAEQVQNLATWDEAQANENIIWSEKLVIKVRDIWAQAKGSPQLPKTKWGRIEINTWSLSRGKTIPGKKNKNKNQYCQRSPLSVVKQGGTKQTSACSVGRTLIRPSLKRLLFLAARASTITHNQTWQQKAGLVLLLLSTLNDNRE